VPKKKKIKEEDESPYITVSYNDYYYDKVENYDEIKNYNLYVSNINNV